MSVHIDRGFSQEDSITGEKSVLHCLFPGY